MQNSMQMKSKNLSFQKLRKKRNRRKRKHGRQQHQQYQHQQHQQHFKHRGNIRIPKVAPPSTGGLHGLGMSTYCHHQGKTENKSDSSTIWLQMYENITKWRMQHQASYWRNVAQKLKHENEQLKQELRVYKNNEEEPQADKEETYEPEESDISEESDYTDENEIDIDEGYLNFMTITQKHQKHMKELKSQTTLN